MVAQLDTPDGPLTVVNTHLSFVPGWNRLQLRHLRRDLAALPGPHVLMGDLNMAPPAPERITGMRGLGRAVTFPAGAPARQLDHVLVDRGGPLLERHCSAPMLPISDHRPLIVDVEAC